MGSRLCHFLCPGLGRYQPVVQVVQDAHSPCLQWGQSDCQSYKYSVATEYQQTTNHKYKANVRSAVSKGYISGLLALYEDWHSRDTGHVAVRIRLALLRCLHQVTRSAAGREAVVGQGGLRLLFHTTQACLLSRDTESLVEPSVQLMRRCHPKTPLLLSDEEESEDEDNEDGSQESESKDFDDDLETDLNKLRRRPEPDRPKELLAQYSQFCLEFTHDFGELESGSEPEESSSSSSFSSSPSSSSSSSSSDEEAFLRQSVSQGRQEETRTAKVLVHPAAATREAPQEPRTQQDEAHKQLPTWSHVISKVRGLSAATSHRVANGEETAGEKEEERRGEEWGEREEEREKERTEEEHQSSLVDRLLATHVRWRPAPRPAAVPGRGGPHQVHPRFQHPAFPDFWGHLPPPRPRSPWRRASPTCREGVEDIQRMLDDGIINQVVFDLEDTNPQCINYQPDTLRFFSKFECGNLRKAVQVRRYEYDLILNADANCSINTQWFYFEVSNMAANIPYRFNVINCEKTNSQFNYGMQPVLYSVREALDGRPHWVRTGTEICYFRNRFCPAHGRRGQTFYTLTFTVTFKHNEDVCYLAYHYPYTYSALQSHLQVLQRSVDPAKVFFRQQSLCDSLAGNPCPLVTITACPASRGWRDMHQLRNRPCIVLTARVHPGESNASWVMRGTLGFLCSRDPVAQSLRETFVFKIIPMLNPDGVVNGT
ncbi:Cytosolic carboxypeptidase 4 [Merluccius polli]|uniref:Cytosolic carboxypeptidase 4 n=1 Tax=Merluccius polli TaxID=89951 RepID=A0AA47MM22_MERPO|nr:Cytosolic carboxypeptidase 4 [Merluccius polli]